MDQLKSKTTQELKALAYDLGTAINQYQQSLQVINQEIMQRLQQEQAETPKSPKTKGAN